MRSLFTTRGFALFLLVLLAITGLSEPLKAIANQIRVANFDKQLSKWLSDLDHLIPQILTEIFRTVHIPGKFGVPGATLELNSYYVFIIIGFIFVIAGLVMDSRAIKSQAFYDDFVALVILYLFLQVAAGVWLQVGFVTQGLRPWLLAVVLTVIVGFFTWRNGGNDDSKIFFRGLLQIYLICLFLFPSNTLNLTTGLIDRLASFGDGATLPIWFPFLSGLSLFVVLPLIYGVGVKPKKPGPSIEDIRKAINEALDEMKKPS